MFRVKTEGAPEMLFLTSFQGFFSSSEIPISFFMSKTTIKKKIAKKITRLSNSNKKEY